MFVRDKKKNKTDSIVFRVSSVQKEVVGKMAKERKMTVTEMLLWLLEMELDQPSLLVRDKKKSQQMKLL